MKPIALEFALMRASVLKMLECDLNSPPLEEGSVVFDLGTV